MKKPFFFAVGLFALLLGVAGVVLPLLPTTPFILLSAYCFAQSSPRFHYWLLNHAYWGRLIKQWQTNRAIPKKAKYLAAVMMALSSLWLWYRFWATPLIALAVLTSVICLAVIMWLWRLPNA